jgi:hypothetical protein
LEAVTNFIGWEKRQTQKVRGTPALCRESSGKKKPGRSREPGLVSARRCYLLLLLPVDFFSPLPMLARLLPLLLPLARSLCASLFWLLAFAPLLPAAERLLLPEDFELRDAIDHSLESCCAARAKVRQPHVDSRSGLRPFCRLCLHMRVGQALCHPQGAPCRTTLELIRACY